MAELRVDVDDVLTKMLVDSAAEDEVDIPQIVAEALSLYKFYREEKALGAKFLLKRSPGVPQEILGFAPKEQFE